MAWTFVSKFDLFARVRFTANGDSLDGRVVEVAAAEVGPRAFGIFYVVETDSGDRYSVEEISMEGELVA